MHQHNHRGQQRQRNGNRRYQSCAGIEQKQKQHGHHQGRAQQYVALNIGDGSFNEAGRSEQVFMHRQAFALEHGLELRQPFFNPQGGFKRVGTELALHHQEHAWRAVDAGRADGRCRGFDDVHHIVHAQYLTAAHDQLGLCQFFHAVDLAVGADDHALVAAFDKAARAQTAGPTRGLYHFFHSDAVAYQCFSIKLHLPLTHFAAEDIHICHACGTEQMRFDGEFSDVVQVHQIALVRGQTYAQYRTGRRGQRRDVGRGHTQWQMVGQRGQFFADQLPVAVQVAVVAEDDGDNRQTGNRLAAHAGDTDGAEHGGLNVAGDQGLHQLS